jgi:hypothetical protein
MVQAMLSPRYKYDYGCGGAVVLFWPLLRLRTELDDAGAVVIFCQDPGFFAGDGDLLYVAHLPFDGDAIEGGGGKGVVAFVK